MLTGLISARELILALLGTDGDWRAALWYEQSNPMLPVPNPPRWGLHVAEWSDDAISRPVRDTIISVWEQERDASLQVRGTSRFSGPRGGVYGYVTVRELVSRLLDVQDADAKLIMTGSFPLHLRVGKVVNEGTPHAYLGVSDDAIWTN